MKIALAAGLMLTPAALLAQAADPASTPANPPTPGGMASDTGAMSATQGYGMHGTMTHRSTTHHAAKHKTTRGASLSNDTPSTPNTSNSKSGPLNSNPH